MAKSKSIKPDEHGRRFGEGAPRAKLTDHEVELIRTLWRKGPGSHVLTRSSEGKKAPAR